MSDCIGPINIIPNNNQVNLQDVNRTITVIDNNCCTTVDVTQPITSVVQVLTGPLGPQGDIGPQGPIGPSGSQGPVGPTGSSQPFSYVSGNIWATTSSIEISGSLIVSGSSTFTNIGLALFSGSTNLSGSGTLNGYDILTSNNTGSLLLSSSFNNFTSSYYVDSASFNTRILNNSSSITLLSGSYLTSSGSFSTRITALEQFSSSLNATFATDAELNTATASLNSSISILSSSYIASSASFNASISSLTSATSSYVLNSQTSSMTVLSASYAKTASYITLAQTASYVTTAQTASYVLNAVSSSYAKTASYIATASWANNAITASYITTAQTASYVLNAVSSSYASTASLAPNYLLLTGGTINGNVTVNGTASVTFLNVTYESSSVIYSSGSNQFGDATNDTQLLIGTTKISGSLQVTGSVNIPSITGSLLGTASYSNQALSSSYAVTASYIQLAQTASYVLNAVSSSYTSTASYVQTAQTASYVTLAQTASYILQAVSASYSTLAQTANTASYVLTAQTASYVTLAQSASYVLNAVSASYAKTASYVQTAQTASSADNFNVRVSLTASGLHYPTTDGTYINQVLQTDAAGNLSFGDVSTIYETIYNAEATTLTKGTVVYISGSQGANPKVYRANAYDPTKMPASHIIAENIDTLSTGRGIQLGLLSGINLTGLGETGTQLWVDGLGTLTNIRPTSSTDIIQPMAVVVKSGNGGAINILNPGPVLLPNIATGYTWVGNSNNQPIAITTSSIQNVVSSSYALTASYALNGGGSVNTGSLLTTASVSLNTITFTKGDGSTFPITVDTGSGGGVTFPYTGSAIITGSLVITGSTTSTLGFTGSLQGTASWANNAVTASYILNAISSSFSTTSSYALTASYIQNAQTASYVLQAISSSYSTTSSYSSNSDLLDGKDSTVFATTGSNLFIGTQEISGALQLNPTIDPGSSNTTSSFLFVTSSGDNTEFNLHYRNNGALWETHWLEERTDTGLVWGGILTFTGTTMSITPGAGLIINHNANTGSHGDTVPTYIQFGPITASATFITSSQVTYLLIDTDGSLIQQTSPFTPQQFNEKLPLGYIFCLTTSSISSYADARTTTYGQDEQQSQFIRAFGPLKVSGCDITPQSGSLKISIASGRTYRFGGFYTQDPDNPSIYDSSTVATGSLVRVYRDPAVVGGFKATLSSSGFPFTDIDPTMWDDGSGTLQAVGASEWTIQRVFQGVVNGISYVYYGQNTYDSLNAAVQSITTEAFEESPTSIIALPFIGYIIARGNTTDLGDTTNNKIINSGLFRNTAGSSGGGGVATTNLNDLADVNITSPSTGQALVYNAGLWENNTPLNSTSASYADTASYVELAQTASYITTAQTASYVLQAVSSSFASTASYVLNAVSSSYASTASYVNGMTVKSNAVTNTSFTGNPKKATVTFTTAFPDTNYSITITGEDSRTWTIESKLAGSFVINANSNIALTGNTYWHAINYGEYKN